MIADLFQKTLSVTVPTEPNESGAMQSDENHSMTPEL